jgi:hypothetical protein
LERERTAEQQDRIERKLDEIGEMLAELVDRERWLSVSIDPD